MVLKTIAKALFLAVFLSAPAQAEERWAISQLTFENQGDYEASFYFRYEFDGGRSGTCKLSETHGGEIQPGASVSIRLDNSEGSIASCDVVFNDDLIGVEVYGIIIIDDVAKARDAPAILWKKSCRKFGTRFHWHPDGGNAIVKSGGTAQRNNRCKLVDTGGVPYTGELR
nr:hypothetical protein [Hyphomonas sp. Mor2]